MKKNNLQNPNKKLFIIWLVGVSFALFQFSLQLSSGVILSAIMAEMNLSAFAVGLLGSSFYIIYCGLQMPVGALFDREKTHIILATSSMVCGIGCAIFAHAHGPIGLFIGRMLIGTGSAFAFVGFSHLIRQHFPLKKFSLIIGASETLSFLATAISVICMGAIVSQWGWRNINYIASIVAIIIAFSCFKKIPDTHNDKRLKTPFIKQILSVISMWRLWVNGIFSGLEFAVITVFGSLWAIPFLQTKLTCTIEEASFITSFLFIATGLSCVIFGLLPNYVKSRRCIIITSCLLSAVAFFTLLFLPTQNHSIIIALIFLTGLFCGGYILSYSISNELSPDNAKSTGMGFTNTLTIATAPILQPVIGYLLDNMSHSAKHTIADYQKALLIIPIGLLIAGFLSIMLPEKNKQM